MWGADYNSSTVVCLEVSKPQRLQRGFGGFGGVDA